MGCIGIQCYELIDRFGCKKLIGVGCCGGMEEKIDLYDVIIGEGGCSD